MRSSLSILFVILFALAKGQNIRLVSEEKLPKLRFEESYQNAAELRLIKQNILFQLSDEGYLSSGIDTTIVKDGTAELHLYLGPKFKWSQLKVKGADEEAINYAGYRGPSLFLSLDRKVNLLLEKMFLCFERHAWADFCDMDVLLPILHCPHND